MYVAFEETEKTILRLLQVLYWYFDPGKLLLINSVTHIPYSFIYLFIQLLVNVKIMNESL